MPAPGKAKHIILPSHPRGGVGVGSVMFFLLRRFYVSGAETTVHGAETPVHAPETPVHGAET